MLIYINGEVAHIPLAQLIAEGKEIVKREGLRPKTQGVNLDLWAASIAVTRYKNSTCADILGWCRSRTPRI
jgi:hypothetical protein